MLTLCKIAFYFTIILMFAWGVAMDGHPAFFIIVFFVGLPLLFFVVLILTMAAVGESIGWLWGRGQSGSSPASLATVVEDASPSPSAAQEPPRAGSNG